MEECNIQHRFSDARCIRTRGHEGRCWSRAYPDGRGAIHRAEWYSKDGVFHSHYAYVRIGARNSKGAHPCQVSR